MDKYEIAVLAEDYEAKRHIFDWHRARNVYGLTPEERSKATAAYHIAEAEMDAAYRDLQRAKARKR